MSLEKLMEGWRRFLNEEEQKPVLYTGAVVHDVEDLKLKLDSIQIPEECKSWLRSSIGSHGHEQLNHHMTIVPSPAAKSKQPIPVGDEAQLKIVGFGVDEALGIAAWKVETDLYVQSGVPHITAMLKDNSVKPFLAAKIKNWNPIDPFTVSAQVIEVSSK